MEADVPWAGHHLIPTTSSALATADQGFFFQIYL